MRTPQRKAGTGGPGPLPRPRPRRSPRRVLAGRSAGGALRKPPYRAQRARRAAQAEGCPRPTLIQGPGATEHRRSDRHRPTGFARLAQPPAEPAAALQMLAGCATAGARPAAALGGGLDRGRRLRRPARHRCGVSEANGTGAAPSRAGGKGRPARAAGCGRLPSGSRGHPCNFPGVEL